MKRSFTLTLATLAVTLTAHGQSLVLNGTSYSGYFGPAGNVTVVSPTPPSGSILSVNANSSPASGALGTYWQATATGGATLGLLGGKVSDTDAQVALTGSALQFNITNNPGSILGSLGVGTGLGLSWSATSKFNVGGNQLVLQPNTTYQVQFDVATGSGLLNSALGIAPSFGVSLLDGANNVVGTASSGTVVNILGLSLVNVVGASAPTGRATVQFTTGNTVGTGAASLQFTGAATLPVTLGSVGTNFANISNVSVNAVPEASTFAIAALGGLVAAGRRRR